MGFLSNPKLLLYVRYVQILISLIFFVLLCYSSTHRGYWDHINGAVGLGVFASIFTWTTAGYNIYTLHRNLTNTSTLISILRIVQEIILVLAWAGTAALMIKPKDKNYRKSLGDDPPWKTWTVDIVLTFIEFLLFVFSALLTVMTRGSGTKAAAPPYV